MTILLFKEYLNTRPTCIIHRSLKLTYLLKPAQISFHLLDKLIHLFQRTTIRQCSIDIQHYLTLVTIEVTAVVYLLCKETERTSQNLIYNRFDIFFINSVIEYSIIPFSPFSFCLYILYLFWKHEYRKPETKH